MQAARDPFVDPLAGSARSVPLTRDTLVPSFDRSGAPRSCSLRALRFDHVFSVRSSILDLGVTHSSAVLVHLTLYYARY